MECSSTSRRLDLALLETFPAIRHAFSYGSAAFPQPGLYASGKLPMRDYMFVVECPHSWHHLVRVVFPLEGWLQGRGFRLVCCNRTCRRMHDTTPTLPGCIHQW